MPNHSSHRNTQEGQVVLIVGLSISLIAMIVINFVCDHCFAGQRIYRACHWIFLCVSILTFVATLAFGLSKKLSTPRSKIIGASLVIGFTAGVAIQLISYSALQLAIYASASERTSFTASIVIRHTVRKFCKTEIEFYDSYIQRNITDCADSTVIGNEEGRYGKYSAIVAERRGPLGIRLGGITIAH